MKTKYAIIVSAMVVATALIGPSESQAQSGGRYCRQANGNVYHRSSTPCRRGETEVPGPNGAVNTGSPSAISRDSFFGGTGPVNLVPGNAYAVNEVNIFGAPGTLFTSTLDTCSKVEFRFDVQAAPGAGNNRLFSIRADNNGGLRSNVAACSIEGSGTSCTGSASFAYFPGDSISIVAQDSSAANASNARWAVSCAAH